MKLRNIIIADDEAPMRRILEIIIQKMGYHALCAGNGREALELVQAHAVDLIVSDLRMPEMNGLELLQQLRRESIDVPVIVITAFGTIETAVEAMKFGASDYIIRPFQNDVVILAIERALKYGQLQQENRFLREQIDSGWHEFIGNSEPMRKVYADIKRIAPAGSSVFITGETGTGKELAARAIHRASGREGLFVPINCAAIPVDIMESELFGYSRGAFTGANKDHAGKFELSDGGTLFLDEITEMPIQMQSKLLRVLQENTVERLGSNKPILIDTHIIAATNRDPLVAVSEKHLRQDLYYRLNVLQLILPPLRNRRDDIPMLTEFFLKKIGSRLGRPAVTMDRSAIDSLMRYSWPGNVREMENIIERAIVLNSSGAIQSIDLPSDERPHEKEKAPAGTPMPQENEDLALQPRVEQLEKTMIEAALGKSRNNKSKAAKLLDISERSLWYKIKKLDIQA